VNIKVKGMNIYKGFDGFMHNFGKSQLVATMKPKGHLEINWPLGDIEKDCIPRSILKIVL
jgi:hypothetical protein